MTLQSGVNGSQQPVGEVKGRACVRVVVVNETNHRVARFLNHPVLSGADDSRWFPVSYHEEIFEALERILTEEDVAVNVTRLEPVSAYQGGRSWDVTYNVMTGEA